MVSETLLPYSITPTKILNSNFFDVPTSKMLMISQINLHSQPIINLIKIKIKSLFLSFLCNKEQLK